MFQSRKRFRHCWSYASSVDTPHLLCFNRESDSVTVGALREQHTASRHHVSIAKAIPSLLEPIAGSIQASERIVVSIAKAIPSLLEQYTVYACYLVNCGFNRESDSVTVGALVFAPSRPRLRCFNRESDSVTVGAENHPP